MATSSSVSRARRSPRCSTSFRAYVSCSAVSGRRDQSSFCRDLTGVELEELGEQTVEAERGDAEQARGDRGVEERGER